MLILRGRGRENNMRTAGHTAAGSVTARLDEPGHDRVTLLELVDAICDVTDDDQEVVATVVSLLRSGRVELCGSFRGHPASDFS